MSSYDQNLLGDAPKATRAQLQEGYSVDLLEQPAEPPRRTPSVRSPPPLPPTPHPGSAPINVPLPQAIEENGSGEKLDVLPSAVNTKIPFWRTRNGIIIMTIVALIVIGAVVGGAVGGTVGKKSSNTNVIPTTSSRPAPASTVNQGGQTTVSEDIVGVSRSPTTSASPTSSAATSTVTGKNNIN